MCIFRCVCIYLVIVNVIAASINLNFYKCCLRYGNQEQTLLNAEICDYISENILKNQQFAL